MSKSFVSTTHDAYDGAGYLWDITDDGSIYDGTDNAFGNAMQNYDLDNYDYLSVESGSFYTTLPSFDYYGLAHERQIYVSQTDGFARFLDTVTNVSDASASYTYELITGFGGGSYASITSSSGDALVANDDTWITASSSSSSWYTSTPSGVLVGNSAGFAGSDFSLSYGTLYYEMSVTLNPGESVSFLSFAVQRDTVADVATALEELEALPLGTLAGLDAAQIDRIVNWDLPEMALDLEGTDKADVLSGVATDDVIRGLKGNDLITGEGGDDELRGGLGKDTVFGGAGDDEIYGDGSIVKVTTTDIAVDASGEQFALSLTMDDAGAGKTTRISGFLSRQEITSEDVDVLFAIDVSGSTDDTFYGQVDVGDRNGDGLSNTVLDAEIASFEALHASIISDANLPDAQITIAAFDDDANVSQSFRADQDSDGDGVADVVEYVRSLTSGGSTNFEGTLDAALSHFTASDSGQKVLYFLSDGEDTSYGDFASLSQQLLANDVLIQTFGVGSNASEEDLDIVDDAQSNGSTTIVLDPSLLSDELLDPGIDAADIKAIKVFLNDKQVGTIDPEDLISTPLGLRYFDLELTGLKAKADDVVEIRAIAADGSGTVVSTSQVLEHYPGKDGADILRGGAGDDTLDGGLGNDLLNGGTGADYLYGAEGRDTASYAGAESGVLIDLRNERGHDGAALGDTLVSIENVTGSAYGDDITGDNGANALSGRGGDDVLNGLGKSDILHGGAGDDTLTGGAGKDRFVFNKGDDVDTITDFGVKVKGEKIDLRDFDIDTYADLKSMMSVTSGDTHIAFGGGDVLIIEDTLIAQLSAGDFML